MEDISPDYILYLKIDPVVALERVNKRNEDISEFENLELLKKISFGFDEIFKNRENVITIDVTEKSEDIALEEAIHILQSKNIL